MTVPGPASNRKRSLCTSPRSPSTCQSLCALQVAAELIEDAKAQLEGYGRLKAAPLLAMADYIYQRDS